MAQTGSAQREPSMEEILASIRRIIEDSDAVRSPSDDGIPADVEVASPQATPAVAPMEAADDTEIVAFRAGLDERGRDEQPEYSADEATVDDEDPSEPELSAPQGAQIHPLRGDTRPLEPVAYSSPLDQEAAPEAPSFRDEEEVQETDIAAPTAVSHESDIADDGRQALISEQTGRQVAAAFGELSEAFASSRRRSFDEMAEEMLRPMLQDWLDNNLPTLVERLVRDEIERVARGS